MRQKIGMGPDQRRGSVKRLGIAALIAIALGATVAFSATTGAASSSPPASPAAIRTVDMKVPLPESGRQMFAVAKVQVKQSRRPPTISAVRVTNVPEIPDSVRAGAATAGPRKKRGGRWEYVLLVAMNDLGSSGPAAVAHGAGDMGRSTAAIEAVVRKLGAKIAPFPEEKLDFASCPSKPQFDQELDRMRRQGIKYWEINKQLGYPTADKDVIKFARQDSNEFCEPM